MPYRTWAYLSIIVVIAIAGCHSSRSPDPPAKGRIVVTLTIDWEGAYLSPEGLDALDGIRKDFGDAPFTHFVSAAYFAKENPDPTFATFLAGAVRKNDELCVHLHAWRSLAKAAGVDEKQGPSFLSGNKLLEFEDGDVGLDLDPDAYTVLELRALLRTSRRLLSQANLRISKSFRAGGYLATPKVLEAIHDEGFIVDASAVDYRMLDERKHELLPSRLKEIWPKIVTTSQPFFIEGPAPQLLELPLAGVADYSTVEEMIEIFDAARARLQKEPGKDVFVSLAMHQENATEFAVRIAEVMAKVRARKDLSGDMVFTTIEKAGEMARSALAKAP